MPRSTTKETKERRDAKLRRRTKVRRLATNLRRRVKAHRDGHGTPAYVREYVRRFKAYNFDPDTGGIVRALPTLYENCRTLLDCLLTSVSNPQHILELLKAHDLVLSDKEKRDLVKKVCEERPDLADHVLRDCGVSREVCAAVLMVLVGGRWAPRSSTMGLLRETSQVTDACLRRWIFCAQTPGAPAFDLWAERFPDLIDVDYMFEQRRLYYKMVKGVYVDGDPCGKVPAGVLAKFTIDDGLPQAEGSRRWICGGAMIGDEVNEKYLPPVYA